MEGREGGRKGGRDGWKEGDKQSHLPHEHTPPQGSITDGGGERLARHPGTMLRPLHPSFHLSPILIPPYLPPSLPLPQSHRPHPINDSNTPASQLLPAKITMAPRGRKPTIKEVPVKPPPAPTLFLSLPDIAHACIASFLPDGDEGGDCGRLRVSEVSRPLVEFYGGTLTIIYIFHREGSSAARLAALLRRQGQGKHVEVTLCGQESIPAFCQAIVQGCCPGIEKLVCCRGQPSMTQANWGLLAGALKLDGALAGLKNLNRLSFTT